jgi:hypothetical protein
VQPNQSTTVAGIDRQTGTTPVASHRLAKGNNQIHLGQPTKLNQACKTVVYGKPVSAQTVRKHRKNGNKCAPALTLWQGKTTICCISSKIKQNTGSKCPEFYHSDQACPDATTQ